MSEYICGVCKYQKEKCKCNNNGWWTEELAKCPDSIKQSSGKTPMGNLLQFPYALEQVSKVREYGNKKYQDPESYKQIPTELLLDACMRHLFKDGNDEETGVNHLASAIMNLLMIIEKDRL